MQFVFLSELNLTPREQGLLAMNKAGKWSTRCCGVDTVVVEGSAVTCLRCGKNVPVAAPMVVVAEFETSKRKGDVRGHKPESLKRDLPSGLKPEEELHLRQANWEKRHRPKRQRSHGKQK